VVEKNFLPLPRIEGRSFSPHKFAAWIELSRLDDDDDDDCFEVIISPSRQSGRTGTVPTTPGADECRHLSLGNLPGRRVSGLLSVYSHTLLHLSM
jgi:hypothetical protein